MDISLEGLRFEIEGNIPSEKEIRGTVTFSNGESRDIEGSIVWMHGNEIGLKFK